MAEIKTTLTIDPLTTGSITPAGRSAGALSTGWRERFADARRGQGLDRLAPSLSQELVSRLRVLRDSAASFSWPDQGLPLDQSRAVSSADPSALAASLPALGQARTSDRLFSRGFDPDAATSLAPGAYDFDLGLDGETRSLSVTVSSGQTNADVLAAVAAAVNDSDLPVQARTVFQSAPEQRVAGQVSTGLSLVLSVNPARSTDDPTLRDTSGHLLESLDLRAAAQATDSAATGVIDAADGSPARVTSYSSKVIDPGGAAGIAPGTYSLVWSSGPSGGTVTFTVNAGDSWSDVIQNLARELNLAQDRFTASVQRLDRPVYDADHGRAVVEGQALAITQNQGKLGERLVLTGADDASRTALSALGLNATAAPGADGRLTLDGRSQVRQPGVFDADQGRVLATVRDFFAGDLPLTVTSALDSLESGLASAVNAYNGLRSLLVNNADLLQSGLAEDWRTPLAAQSAALQDLGLRETGQDKLLWLDAEAFYAALGRDPAAARDLLSGDSGLLTTWGKAASTALSGDPARFLSTVTAEPVLGQPAPLAELDLERKSRLLDLYEQPGTKTGNAAATWDIRPGLLDESG